jgi:GDP-mannose 6-dehydrogenase
MKIIVWGLGCCGLINAAWLAQRGHEVVGVDVDTARIGALSTGDCDIEEPGLAAFVNAARPSLKFACSVASSEIASSDLSLICVGAPESSAGIDTIQIENVVEELSRSITHDQYHSVVIRSTAPVGFLRNRALLTLQRNHPGALGRTYGLALLPEFLREGCAIEDFVSPLHLIIACMDIRTEERLMEIYRPLTAPFYKIEPEEAEALKLTNNAFHALKIGFANEIGRFCASVGIEPGRIMDLICRDTRLNISSAYLRPGAPFGGSCLDKDLATIIQQAEGRGLELPLLEAVARSNRLQIELSIKVLSGHNVQRIGFLGLSFKAGTGDLRNSPALEIARRLKESGYEIVIYDPDVSPDRLARHDIELLESTFGKLSQVFAEDTNSVVLRADVVAVMHRRSEFAMVRGLAARRGTKIVDFAESSFDWLRNGKVLPLGSEFGDSRGAGDIHSVST